MLASISSLVSHSQQVVGYVNSVKSSIHNASGFIYLILKENKKSTAITAVGTIVYGVLSYYEIISITKIHEDLHSYRTVFSLFAGNAQADNSCPLAPLDFGYRNQACLKVEGELLNSLLKGRNAVAKYVAILFFKPLSLQACTHALTFSLRSILIKKWLENNNHLGLKILNNGLSTEAREILYEYSGNLIRDVIARASSVVEVIIAFGKIYDIYQIGCGLSQQGLEFDLLSSTTLAITAFLITNIMLSSASRRYAESNLKSQTVFKENISFNMDNALYVACSQASQHEFNLLEKLLNTVTQAHLQQSLLNTGILTVSMSFTYSLNFIILGLSIPSLVKNPNLYFSIQPVSVLITHLCNSLWGIFETISSSLTFHYFYNKVSGFINEIDQYQKLMLERENFKFIIDPTAHLACDITIKYPIHSKEGHASYNVLLHRFKKEFVAGQFYAITGPSGTGKSSFFNALIGINPYAVGKVTIPCSENIIYIPQKPALKQNLTWIETILYPYDGSLLDHETHVKLQRKVLKWVGLLKLDKVYISSGINNSWVSNLSGGEAQRLTIIQALARIFICREKSTHHIVLLLDECLNALDPIMQEIVFRLMNTYVEKHNLTAIHIDHSDQRIIKERYKQDCIIHFPALVKEKIR